QRRAWPGNCVPGIRPVRRDRATDSPRERERDAAAGDRNAPRTPTARRLPVRQPLSRFLRTRALQCATMLKRLTLRDFAVVPESELEFGPGMTVISGETGAGKSLLVDALGFLSGLRADAGMVRHGAQRAELH